ncbi:MAG: shikimate dehydrogenase family protein [Saprospiraceae bacterium]
MFLYGLIGYPLGHSFSKKYFSEKFEREGVQDAGYKLFPLDSITGLTDLLAQNPELRGLNVTIPYKETILPLLQRLDETARAVGAANCVKILDTQELVGFNTDVIGFERSLASLNMEALAAAGSTALILGTGGASKAVAFVLKKLRIPFKFVSRKPENEQEISYEEIANQTSPAQIKVRFIVNTTPCGTFPNTDQMPPLPPDFLKPDMLVYDLIYNPAETLLLREAKARGCAVKNGYEMLELQAEASWDIWQSPPEI